MRPKLLRTARTAATASNPNARPIPVHPFLHSLLLCSLLISLPLSSASASASTSTSASTSASPSASTSTSASPSASASTSIPPVFSDLSIDSSGTLTLHHEGRYYPETLSPTHYPFSRLFGSPRGTDTGVLLDFGPFRGTLIYGLIPYGKSDHPQPVYRIPLRLDAEPVHIDIHRRFRYPYDFVDWQTNAHLSIGYRLVDSAGQIIYNGEVSLTGTGPFTAVPSIYEGPFVSNVHENGFTVWFHTTDSVTSSLTVDGRTVSTADAPGFAGTPSTMPGQFHRFDVSGLKPATHYPYTVHYGSLSQSYSAQTAPRKGSRKPFVFAYSSDSREAVGHGERSTYGANTYIMKKIAALAYSKEAAFLQFTGDMINGYLSDINDQHLEYTNWKYGIESFWHYMPVYVGMGNHESFGHKFLDEEGRWLAFLDGFPWNTRSSEKLFGDAFVNPLNGPASEDGHPLDPEPSSPGNFPPYDESVYYYTYANTAVIVLNSDYWYTPTLKRRPAGSGNLHGYLMTMQMRWLEETLAQLEKDRHIDHIFVTQHTPAFPNGGHSGDDMWYSGDNSHRPLIAGQPVEKGIIQRRDEFLNLLINRSSKVVALLTGDEHNYNRLKLTDEVPIYPEDWPYESLNVSRPIYQINNGAAGAPYYGQEVLPWSDFTEAFSVEHALCLFYVDGKKITLKVYNPDTLGLLDELRLR